MESDQENIVLNRLAKKLELSVTEGQEKREALVNYLNYLIDTDSNKLLHILYRIDVAEEKVKAALSENHFNQTTGKILAQLLIQRESKKPAK